jgi:hypothetical protein
MNQTLENLLLIIGSGVLFTGSCTFLWFICKKKDQPRRDTMMTDALLIESVEV